MLVTCRAKDSLQTLSFDGFGPMNFNIMIQSLLLLTKLTDCTFANAFMKEWPLINVNWVEVDRFVEND